MCKLYASTMAFYSRDMTLKMWVSWEQPPQIPCVPLHSVELADAKLIDRMGRWHGGDHAEASRVLTSSSGTTSQHSCSVPWHVPA
jgi:hypothetical protein